MESENQTVVNTQPTVIPQKKNNLPKILAVLLLVLLALGAVAGAYYLGSQNNQNQNLSTAPTPTVEPKSQNPSVTSAPTPTTTTSKIVEAGGNIGVFMPYKISVPDDWKTSHSSTKDTLDELTITKGAYKIEIRQFGGEGATCLYGNEPEEPFTNKYETYIEFQSLDENFRRSGELGGKGWTICHQTKSGWGFPTLYGYISYTNPANADEAILKQMDQILSTIVKQ